MKVLLVSNGNPHFRNTNHYRCRALEALGHEVVFFDVRRYKIHPRLRETVPFLEHLELKRINRDLVTEAGRIRPQVVIFVGGVGVSSGTIQDLRTLNLCCLLWTTDIPETRYFKDIAATAPEYDRVFCAGTETMEALRDAGHFRSEWLPFACDPELHAPVALTDAERAGYHKDIVFVGSYYPNRGEVLAALTGFNLGVWGPLWDRLPESSPLKPFVNEARLDYEEWRRIYAAAGIVIVVHYQDGKVPCYQASPKLYEAMACGAFVLCDAQKDAMTLFRDGEHVVFFRNTGELKEKADYYLAHPEERSRIAAQGRQEVITRHTYLIRMEELLRGTQPRKTFPAA